MALGQERDPTCRNTTYTYDSLGQLRSAALPTHRIDYLIDPAGMRIGKQVDGLRTEGFIYDVQGRVLAELDGSGNLVSQFAYGTRRNVPDLMMQGGKTYRLVSDYLGSVRLVVDTSTSEVAQQIDYDVWGNVTNDTSPGFQPFGFAGGLYDEDTGLVRFGARDYDPTVGRWTSKDPILFGGGQANIYIYVNNDPVNSLDPSGLAWGLIAGASTEGGLGDPGFTGGQASLMAPYGSSESYVSFGVATGSDGAYGTSANSPNPSIVGAYAGMGAGLWYTSQSDLSKLLGYFENYSVNLPFISINIGVAGDTRAYALLFGPSIGASVSKYGTWTWGTADMAFAVTRFSGGPPCP